jgi:hypothetical protein
MSMRKRSMGDPREAALAAIQKCVDGQEYCTQSAESWCTAIVSEILQRLKPGWTPQYKFVASCMILSRRSQYVNETRIAFWDAKNDLRITTKWSNETMQYIVSAWAFKTRFA